VSQYPNDWTAQSVGNCISVLSLPGKPKLPTTAYKDSGRFPIIDQGQGLIAGWTDDPAGVIATDLPVIVFGDHTRAIKYLDRPFVRGADGTQVLKPRADIDPLFLYYACRSVDVPSRGYNRHFSVFKNLGIAVPSEPTEQERIGKVMRAVEAAHSRQVSLVDTSLSLKRATMRELFTRGLRREPQKETSAGPMPHSWDLVPFDQAVVIAQGQVDPKVEPYASMVHVGPENIEPGTGHLLACRTARDLSLISGKYRFSSGDIVYSKIRPHLNKVAMPPFDGLCSADMYPLRARGGVNARFVFHYLLSDWFLRQAVPHQLRTGIPKINRDELSSTFIPKPSHAEQADVVAILDAIDRKIDLHRRKKAVLEELFKSLLHKLMTGEIRVTDLDLSALTALEEARS
jgi:type I restriction enzyme S subunit